MRAERIELEVVRTPASEASGERPFGNERELSAIVTHMWENAETLVRAELDLGLKELDIRVDKLKQSLLMATIGGAVLYAGVLTLVATIVIGLSKVLEPWIASLIVGVLVTGVGAVMCMRGEKKGEEAVEPDEHLHRTKRAMKEAFK